MTITLAPETEQKLNELAAREGRDVNTLADALLAHLMEDIEQDYQEMLAAVTEALESDPAEDMSFEDYQAQMEAEQKARRHTYEDIQKVAA